MIVFSRSPVKIETLEKSFFAGTYAKCRHFISIEFSHLKMPASSLVLASTSRYRRDLLARLRLPFEVAAPGVDETPQPHEAPMQLALRLAQAKMHAVAGIYPEALIIGSDQVAAVGGNAFANLLNKPDDHANAVRQLQAMRGQAVSFFTALCLLNAKTNHVQTAVVTIVAHMRDYSDDQIERYLTLEQPYDCAGSARIEDLGISLVSRLECEDPTALIGLPLMRLCDMLRHEGIDLP